MAIQILGQDGLSVAKVDTNGAAHSRLRDGAGNDLAYAHRELLPANIEALLIAGKNDQLATILRTDRKGNLISGNYQSEMLDNFEGATANVQKWLATAATFAQAQTTLGGYNLTSTGSTAAAAHSNITSLRLFTKYQRVPLQIKARIRHNIVANSFGDFGFGVPATTTQMVPNGTQVRFLTSGSIQLVQTINSVEVASTNVLSLVASNGNTVGAALNMSNAYYTSGYFVYDLIVDDDNAVVTIQDTQTGELIGQGVLAVPKDQYKMWGATALPVYFRAVNSSTPTTSPLFFITDVQVLATDLAYNFDASQLAGHLHLSAGRQPFTGAQNENHTNNTAPTSATLSNTAAGYTTLGGKFQFAAVAGAETDYALFGFTVPAGSRFACEGLRIDTVNTGAAVATTATLLEWAAGFNNAAVSLASGVLVRRQLGLQTFPIGAAIGAQATPIDVLFGTPEVVESGRFLHVIVKSMLGTATASQIIRGQVLVRGRFL